MLFFLDLGYNLRKENLKIYQRRFEHLFKIKAWVPEKEYLVK